MRLVHVTRGFAPMSLVNDGTPILQNAATGVAFVVRGRKGGYRVELTLEECQRIAEAIGWQPIQYAGHLP
jgi:hypothetical protein